MTTTVHVDENPGVRVTEERLESRPPDRIGFHVEGVIRPTRSLLGAFEGSSLTPVRVDVSVGPSRTVALDLADGGFLRLESVDVGVESPAVSDAVDLPGPEGEDDAASSDGPDGAVAFTVEGSIRDLPEETVAAVSDGSPSLESITFSVADTLEADGGSPLDVLLDVRLLGFGIVVRRNGTIEIRARSSGPDLGLG